MQLSALPSLDQLSLHRLLRRESVARCVLGLRIAFTLGAGILLVGVGYEVYRTVTEVQAHEARLAGRVEAARGSAAPRARPKSAPQELGVIVERNIFGRIEQATLPQATPPPKPVAVTPLGLVGTFVVDGQAPYAIIEDQKKKVQDVFDLGQMVFNEAKLLTILADRVEIERHGQRETLLLEDGPGARSDYKDGVATLENDEYIVDEGELDRALENLPLLLTQARAVPYFADGKAVGLRLFAIKSGSLYEKIGLRNGDILKTLNGNNLGDISQAMQLFEKLKNERSIALRVERNREEKEFRYTIR